MDMLNTLLEKKKVAQDKDIKDRDGTQPKKYFAKDADGDDMAKSTKDARARHFEKGRKSADDDDSAYEPAPGDKSAKTKPSKHTKKYKKMFGEGEQDECWDGYTQKGMKKKGDKMVPNCVPEETVNENVAVKQAELKAKQVEEMESLKEKQEKELEALKLRHERENEKLSKEKEGETEREKLSNESVEEGKYVSDYRDIVDVIFKKIKSKIEKDFEKNQEKGVAIINTLGAMVGHKVTDKGQEKHKLFLKFGEELEERYSDVIRKRTQSQQKAHQKAMMKSAKKSIKDYDAKNKNKKESVEEDCWSGYKQVGMKKKNGKDVPNCVPEAQSPAQQAAIAIAKKKAGKEENDPAIEKQKDGTYSYKRQVIKEEIDELFEGFMASKVKSVTVNKKMYDHALKTLKDVLTRKKKEAKAKKTGMRHSSEYYAAQIARTYKDVDGKVLHKMLGEEYIFEAGGAGDRGTTKLTKRYKKDTPGETVNESIDDLFEAQFKVEVEGLPDMFIDAKSAGEVKSTLRKKLKKPDDVQSIERVTPDKIKKHFRMVVRGDQDPTSINEDVTQKQLSDLEKFADRLLDKFGVDVEFTRHFADRMNDDRNKPKITIPELQRFFKKVAKNKAKDIKQLGDSEAVLKDIQADLNLPVVINYDKNKEEFEVVNKTIMRKKDFKTPDKVVKY